MAEEQLQFNITGDATKLITELERAARAVASAKTAFNGIKSTLSEVAQTSSSLSASMEKATGSVNKSASATRSNTKALSDLANAVKLLAGSVSSLDEKISKLASATTKNTTATRQNSAATRDDTNAVKQSSSAVGDLTQKLSTLGNSAKAAKAAMSGIGGNVQVGGAGVGSALAAGFSRARSESGLLNNSVRVLSASLSSLRAAGSTIGSALGGAFDRARSSISNTFSANSGLLASLKQSVGYAVQFYTVGQAIQFVTGAIEHLTSGIVGFNSQLQYTRIAFSAVFRSDQILMFDQAMRETNGNIGQSIAQMNAQIADSYGSISSGLTGTYSSVDEVTSALRQKAKTEAEEYVSILREYANVTPFRLDDIVSAGRRMAAFGFQADEILPSINAIGQQVAAIGGSGEQIDRITYALGQMRTAGKVYAQDMLQLSNAGISGYKILANAAGKTVIEIKELAKKGMLDGKVASEIILTYLQKRFDGAMLDLANTYAGAKTTIADMSRSLVADSFVPLYSAIEKVTINFASLLTTDEAAAFAADFSKNVIAPFTEFAFDLIPAAIEGIAQFFAQIYNSAVTAGTPMNYLISTVAYLISVVQQGIPIAVELLGNQFVQSVIGLIAVFKLLNAVVMGNPILATIAIIVASLGIIDKLLQSQGTSLLEVFKNVVAAAEPVINQIFGFLGAVIPVVVDAASQILPVIMGTIGAIAGFVQSIAPIIGSIIAQVVGIIQNMIPYIQAIIGLVAEAIATIAPVVGTIITAILQIIDAAMPTINFILEVVMGIATIIIGIVTGIIKVIAPIIDFVVKAITPIIVAMMQLFGVIAQVIMVIAKLVMAGIAWAMSLQPVQAAIGAVGWVIGRLGEIAGGVFGFIGALIGFIANAIATGANFAIDIINVLIDAYNAIPFLDDIGKLDKISMKVEVDRPVMPEITSSDATFGVSGDGISTQGISDVVGTLFGDEQQKIEMSAELAAKLQFPPGWGEGSLITTPSVTGTGGGGGGVDKNKQLSEFLAAVSKYEKAMLAALKDLHEQRMADIKRERDEEIEAKEAIIEAEQQKIEEIRARRKAREKADKEKDLRDRINLAQLEAFKAGTDALEASKDITEAQADLAEFILRNQEDALIEQSQAIIDSTKEDIKAIEEKYRLISEAEKASYEASVDKLKERIADLVQQLKDGKATVSDVLKGIQEEWGTLIQPYYDLGYDIGETFAAGLARTKEVLLKEAADLRRIISQFGSIPGWTSGGGAGGGTGGGGGGGGGGNGGGVTETPLAPDAIAPFRTKVAQWIRALTARYERAVASMFAGDSMTERIAAMGTWKSNFKVNFLDKLTALQRLAAPTNISDTNALSLYTSAAAKLQAKGLAKGGPVLPGGMYTVGENGPETLFVGRSGGIVVPNGVGVIGGGGGGSINASVTINNPVVRSDADIRALADRVSAAQASQLRGFGVRT